MIKAVFFDVDGTLITHGDKQMPKSTLEALWLLKKKGIKLFLATGRPPHTIQFMGKMFPFDGYVTANGQYCFNDQEIIFEKYIPRTSIEQLIPYIEEEHIPVVCATLQKNYMNMPISASFVTRPEIVDFRTLLDKPIVQFMAYIEESQDEEFLKHLPKCKTVRWTSVFADVIIEEGGKDKGIQHMIDHYGILLEEVMAFGDGGNDIAMLDYVPYGIAMGNASDDVKTHADYVTSDINDNGIMNAFKHFSIL